MKKLLKRTILGVLTGAMLLSSSVTSEAYFVKPKKSDIKLVDDEGYIYRDANGNIIPRGYDDSFIWNDKHGKYEKLALKYEALLPDESQGSSWYHNTIRSGLKEADYEEFMLHYLLDDTSTEGYKDASRCYGDPTKMKPKVGQTFKTTNKYFFTGTYKVLSNKKSKRTAELKNIQLKKNIYMPSFAGRYYVTKITKNSFKKNTKVKKIVLGRFVDTFGKESFKNCKKVNEIWIRTYGLKSKNLNKNTFKGLHKVTILVPDECVTEYRELFKKKGLAKDNKVYGFYEYLGTAEGNRKYPDGRESAQKDPRDFYLTDIYDNFVELAVF